MYPPCRSPYGCPDRTAPTTNRSRGPFPASTGQVPKDHSSHKAMDADNVADVEYFGLSITEDPHPHRRCRDNPTETGLVQNNNASLSFFAFWPHHVFHVNDDARSILQTLTCLLMLLTVADISLYFCVSISPDDCHRDRPGEYFPGSVYLWACRGKVNPLDDDVGLTDVIIGWLTVMVRSILSQSRAMSTATLVKPCSLFWSQLCVVILEHYCRIHSLRHLTLEYEKRWIFPVEPFENNATTCLHCQPYSACFSA